MDYFLMKLIEQNMKDLGYSWPDYRFESVRKVAPAAGKTLDFHSNNEYHYLVAKTVPASLQITSDLDVLTTNDSVNYANFNFYQVKVFTGSVKIVALVPIDLEFVRVIPRIKEKK